MDTKKSLEAVVLGGVLMMSMQSAFAAAACTAGAAGTITAGTTLFVKTAFSPKCSANVTVDVVDSTTSLSVKSASSKGKTYFGGTTEGGGISACGTFTTMGGITASTSGC